MTPAQILKAAKARIADPAEWGKGARNRQRPLHTCCAAEAIEEVSPGGRDPRRQAFRIFYNAAGLEWGDDALVDWNDAPARTHDEIIKTFNLAIALARNTDTA